MVSTTEHFGLTKLGPNESVHAGSGRFPSDDRDIIDQALYAGINHRHTGNTASESAPSDALELTLSTTGGTLPAGTTIRYKYTYVDPDTGETLASPEATVTTADPLPSPDAPTATLQSIGGTLEPGDYYYVLTQYVGSATVETKALNPLLVTVPAGTSTNEVTLNLPALHADADGFNIYRRSPGQTRFFYIATVADAATPPTEWIDDGTHACDCDRSLPANNTTMSTNSVLVAIPGATPSIPAGNQWKLYRSYTTDFTSSFLVQLTDASLTYEDTGAGTALGAPPSESAVTSAPDKVLLTDGAEVQGVLPDTMVAVDDSAFAQIQGTTLAEVLDFIDTEGVGGGGAGALYTVRTLATTSCPAAVQAAAHYVCDGVNDEEEIEAALAMFEDDRPGVLRFAPWANFKLGRPIDLSKSLAQYIIMIGSSGETRGDHFLQETTTRILPTGKFPVFRNGDYHDLYLRGIVMNGAALNQVKSVADFDMTGQATVFDYEANLNPGYSGQTYISDSDCPAFTDELDLRVGIRDENSGRWAEMTGARTILSKWDTTGNQRSFLFNVAAGVLALHVSANGSTVFSAYATAALEEGFAGRALRGLRATWSATEGVARFYTSSDEGQTWDQVGDPVALAAASIFDSTAPVRIAGHSGTTELLGYNGRIVTAKIMPIIDGDTTGALGRDDMLVFNLYRVGYDQIPATIPAVIDDPAVTLAGGWLSAPTYSYGHSSVVLGGRVAPSQWASGSAQTIIGKWDTATNQRSTLLQVDASGNLKLSISIDGTAELSATSSAPVPFTDGEPGWVLAQWTRYNTSAMLAATAEFYTSEDGKVWTEIGTVQALDTGTANLYDSAAEVTAGAHSSGTDPLIGDLFDAFHRPYYSEDPAASTTDNPTVLNYLRRWITAGAFDDNAATTALCGDGSYESIVEWQLNGAATVHVTQTWTNSMRVNRFDTPVFYLDNSYISNAGSRGPCLRTYDYFSAYQSTIYSRSAWAPGVELFYNYLVGTISKSHIVAYSTQPAILIGTYWATAFDDFAIQPFSFTDNMTDGNKGPVLKAYNYSRGVRASGNVHMYDSSVDFDLYQFENCIDLIVSGNVIEGAIAFTGCEQTLVHSNDLYWSGETAISIDSCPGISVQGNVITGPSTLTPGHSGILLTDTDDANVSGNTVRVDSADGADPGALIKLAGSCNRNLVGYNVLTSNTTAAAVEVADAATPNGTGNVIAGNVTELEIIDNGIETIIECPGDSRRYRKAANETVNNSTTLQNDDDLSFTAKANETYLIEGLLIYSTSVAAGITFGWSLPAGASVDWVVIGEADLALDGAGVGAKKTVAFRGTVTVGATAGTCALQWAQTAADATDTVLHAASHLTVERIR